MAAQIRARPLDDDWYRERSPDQPSYLLLPVVPPA
jgi:hypothetical protein